MPSCEGFDTAPTSGSPSSVPNKQYAPLHVDEPRQLSEYIPGPRRSPLRGCTRGDDRRFLNVRESLTCFDKELKAVFGVQDEVTVEEALMANARVSIEMPTKTKK